MILEFVDKSKINVEVIIGYPTIVNGVERDTLSIEIDPNKHTKDEVNRLIRKQYNLLQLTSYDTDENSNRFIIGEGYDRIIQLEEIRREKKKDPSLQGKIRQVEYENVLILILQQLTYDEWTELNHRLEHSPLAEEVQLWESLQE